MSDFMLNLSYLPVFSVLLTLFAYVLGSIIYKKCKYFPLLNPGVSGLVIIIVVLKILGIDYDTYYIGGQFYTFLLLPTTAALAIPIYRQRKLLKKYFFPIIIGAGVGAFCGLGSVWAMCKLFAYDTFLTKSMLAKSVTTPIAMELTNLLGGEVSIILICVTIAGLSSSFYLPFFLKAFKLKNKVAAGIATGTSSHGFGTGIAMGIDEEMGAMSGLSIGITGIFTVIFGLIIPW